MSHFSENCEDVLYDFASGARGARFGIYNPCMRGSISARDKQLGYGLDGHTFSSGAGRSGAGAVPNRYTDGSTPHRRSAGFVIPTPMEMRVTLRIRGYTLIFDLKFYEKIPILLICFKRILMKKEEYQQFCITMISTFLSELDYSKSIFP